MKTEIHFCTNVEVEYSSMLHNMVLYFITWSVDGAVFEPSVDHAMRMASAVCECKTRSRYNVFGGQRISIAKQRQSVVTRSQTAFPLASYATLGSQGYS